MSAYEQMTDHAPRRKRRGPQAIRNKEMTRVEEILGWLYMAAVGAGLTYGYYKFLYWAFAQ